MKGNYAIEYSVCSFFITDTFYSVERKIKDKD